MIRINLLPETERRSDWPLKKLYKVTSCFLAIILILIYSYNVYIIWHTGREIADLKKQYELLRPTEAVMQDALSKQQVITAKNDILVNLTNERKTWPAVITHLATLTTPRVWFTELGTVNSDSIKIIGLADNYQELAIFLQHLEQDTVFTEPSLVQADTTRNNNRNSITKFEIVVKLKGLKQ